MSGALAPTGGLRLEVVAGQATGERLSIDERLVFGRQTDGPGRLAGDPELSRHHARIARDPHGRYAIEDLSSTNGTFLNGVRLATPTALAAGDLIDMGATRLIVREAPGGPHPSHGPVDVRATTVIDELVPAPPPVAEPTPPPEAVAPAPPLAPVAVAPTPPPEAVAPTPTPPPPPPPPEPVAPVAAVAPAAPPDLEPPTDVTPPERQASATIAATLELRLAVDFELCQAEIGYEEGTAPIRLRFQAGRWRVSNGEL